MTSTSPQPPKVETIVITSRFKKMPYPTQVIDVANQLAQTLYGKQNLTSILGQAQNLQKSKLRNKKIQVRMPIPHTKALQSFSSMGKQDKKCRMRNDRAARKGSTASSSCQCSKCRNQSFIDEKTETALRSIKSMIKHAIKHNIDIIF